MADPDLIRGAMSSQIEQLLNATPGLSLKSRVRDLAGKLGMAPRRLDEYRYGLVSMRSAEEFLAVTNYTQRRAAAEERAAGIRQQIQETKRAYARENADLVRAFGARTSDDGEGLRNVRPRDGLCEESDRFGASDSSADGLRKFATRILACELIPAEGAPDRLRSLLNVLQETGGEFTAGVAEEMRASGTDRRTWLYRADPSFPLLHVGEDIPIVSAEDRERILYRPIHEQPLAPSFLSTVLGQFGEVMRHSRPTLHRISATFGGTPITYDRLTHHLPRSGLFLNTCLPVAQ